ncbi:hypothetical protein [Streptomyces sp. NPDC001889]
MNETDSTLDSSLDSSPDNEIGTGVTGATGVTEDLVSKDNYSPARPHFLADGDTKPKDDTYSPGLPADVSPADGTLAEDAVITKDNYSPAPPRFLKGGAGKPQDNYSPAPPKP